MRLEKQRINAADILTEIAAGNEVHLTACTISGHLDINRFFSDSDDRIDPGELAYQQFGDKKVVTLTETLFFNACIFEDNVVFAPTWSQPDAVSVIFKSDIHFNSSFFRGQTRFSAAVIEKSAAFDGCSFHGVVCFRKTHFKGPAKFRTGDFRGYGLFNNATFQSQALFSNAYFAKGVNLTNVRFESQTDFSGVYAGSKTVPAYDNIYFAKHRQGDDEAFWRFIKQCAQEAGHYTLAGQAFYKERCGHLWFKFRGADYDKLSLPGKILRLIAAIRLLPEYIFGRILFGYGERPVRVLVASAMIIIGCAIAYWVQPTGVLLYKGRVLEDKNFMDCLYFSVTTFATLGPGDMFPIRDHFTRYIVMAEALSGGLLMALFVVSLAKRFSRS